MSGTHAVTSLHTALTVVFIVFGSLALGQNINLASGAIKSADCRQLNLAVLSLLPEKQAKVVGLPMLKSWQRECREVAGMPVLQPLVT